MRHLAVRKHECLEMHDIVLNSDTASALACKCGLHLSGKTIYFNKPKHLKLAQETTESPAVRCVRSVGTYIIVCLIELTTQSHSLGVTTFFTI